MGFLNLSLSDSLLNVSFNNIIFDDLANDPLSDEDSVVDPVPQPLIPSYAYLEPRVV